MTPSSREAQAEIRNAIAKSETAYDAKRGIIGTNLTSDTFDASRGSGRFRREERRRGGTADALDSKSLSILGSNLAIATCPHRGDSSSAHTKFSHKRRAIPNPARLQN
ncbi:MAG: hypothetical protein DMF26_06725 [Verrucomicrobia bacterium]|nr:MAG: hypothetical protein DMF26_06725 [Verrucomicrobiota bacterium]